MIEKGNVGFHNSDMIKTCVTLTTWNGAWSDPVTVQLSEW